MTLNLDGSVGWRMTTSLVAKPFNGHPQSKQIRKPMIEGSAHGKRLPMNAALALSRYFPPTTVIHSGGQPGPRLDVERSHLKILNLRSPTFKFGLENHADMQNSSECL